MTKSPSEALATYFWEPKVRSRFCAASPAPEQGRGWHDGPHAGFCNANITQNSHNIIIIILTRRIDPTMLPKMPPTPEAKWMAQDGRRWTAKLHGRTHSGWGAGLITKNPDSHPTRHKKGQTAFAMPQLLLACSAQHIIICADTCKV